MDTASKYILLTHLSSWNEAAYTVFMGKTPFPVTILLGLLLYLLHNLFINMLFLSK